MSNTIGSTNWEPDAYDAELEDYLPRCPRCGGELPRAEARCPHGNCEHGWPAPDAEGRIDDQEWDDYAADMARLPAWNEGVDR